MPSTVMGVSALRANLTNPQRAFLWEVAIPAPIGSGTSPTILTVRATSTVIPTRSNEEIPIPYKQTAGIVVYGKDKLSHHWTVTFQEDEDAQVYTTIAGWQNSMVDSVQGVNLNGGVYQSDVFLTLLDVTGDNTMQIKLKNSWMSNMAEVPLTYADGAGIVKYPVTFTFDWFEVTVGS